MEGSLEIDMKLSQGDRRDTGVVSSPRDYIPLKTALRHLFSRYISSSCSLYLEWTAFFANVVFIGLLDKHVLVAGCGLGT